MTPTRPVVRLLLPVLFSFAPVSSEAQCFDSPATQALVVRVVHASHHLPSDLVDYRADVFSQLEMQIVGEGRLGNEAPVAVDQMRSTIRWNRNGAVEQTVHGHRVRLGAEVPFTLGTSVKGPWVLPHLYTPAIPALELTGSGVRFRRREIVVHPFGPGGAEAYHYCGDDPVEIRAGSDTLRVVPVEVRPVDERELPHLVGTFYVDVDRAALVRARFIVRRGTALGVSVDDLWEVDHALINGRHWLPYRQRLEVQGTHPLLGVGVVFRVINHFSHQTPNIGWTPAEGERARLIWRLEDEGAHGEWPPIVLASDWRDFDDLRRRAPAPIGRQVGPLRVEPHVRQTHHFLRYNRVEGLFLGAAARLTPAESGTRPTRWYATAGYAFAEGAVRGEVTGRRHFEGPRWPGVTSRGLVELELYRRLMDARTFLPIVDWTAFHSALALFRGEDPFDYYDALGGALSVRVRSDPWELRIGSRWERHRPVERNTTWHLRRDAAGFTEVSVADPGDHAVLEAGLLFRYGLPTAVGEGLVARVEGTWGLGEFAFRRLTGTALARTGAGVLGLRTRLDGARTWGAPPPQFIPRFGGAYGVGGLPHGGFGGTTVVLGRGRGLLALPPRSEVPLMRSGRYFVPALRPHLVASVDAGWSAVTEAARPTLERLEVEATASGGASSLRGSYGIGVSLFDDLVSVEYIRPFVAGDPGLRLEVVRWH